MLVLPNRRSGRGTRRRGASVARTRAYLLAACVLAAGCGDPAPVGESAAAGLGYRPLARPTTTLAVQPGETLADVLDRGGLSAPDVRRLLDMTRPFVDWTSPDRGLEARFHRWPGEPPERIDLRVDADYTLSFDMVGAVWEVTVDSVPVALDTVVVSGLLESSLYAARLGGDVDRLSVTEKADLAGHLAEVFAWQIDFYRDPRPGDAFRVALERAIRPDGSIRRSTVIAAEYARGSALHQAYRFSPVGEEGALYFDEAGSALRGAFLRAPLDLVRVTSRFSNARYHPLLRGVRAHAGVDYGAPSGTPVRATGDGRVVRAGWAGDFGLMIELEHGDGIRTRYAHLGGIADDVAVGQRVSQGDVIAAVGSTGLSTAPHLHYEFRRYGAAIDPTSVSVPVERPIPPQDAGRFDIASGEARGVLGRAYWPAAPAGAHGATGTSEAAR